MEDITKEELEAKVKELEEQNKRLLKPRPQKVTVTEGEYNGFPTLMFEGPFKAFTLGIRKLATVKCVWPRVEEFLSKHSKAAERYMVDEDEKI